MNRERARPGQIHIPHRILRVAGFIATALALLVVVLLGLDRRFGWLQHQPGGEAFDINAQPWFMVAFAVGAVLALRWKLLGGAIAVFTAAALIVFAYHQLRFVDALVVVFGFAVPAVLWLVIGLFELRDEQFHRSPEEQPRPLLRRRDVIGGLGLVGLMAFGGFRLGQWMFNRLYGPTHPSSTTPGVVGSSTRWVWCGAVTDATAAVTTRLKDDDAGPLELLVADNVSLVDPRVFTGIADDQGLVRMDLEGLSPDTAYHYAFVIGGVVDSSRTGRFRTHPRGQASFSVVFGACWRTGSNGRVFDTIRTLAPQMVVIQGDLHYADITRDDQQAFRQVLDHQLSQPAPDALLRTIPVAYVWDDHDYGGVDARSESRPAAMATYRQFVPHYPLASSDSAIYQAFTIGRVRFLLCDARSARRPGDDDADGPDAVGTMLGTDQKEWLFAEMSAAPQDHVLTVWVNPVPWIARVGEEGEGDDWGAFAAERREIADFIADNGLASRLLMVSGDAHMVAIDDGTNSDFSTSGGAGFPVLHSAALDRPGSVKGGPYSHGAFPGGGQFGLVSFVDNGESMAVVMSGRNWRNRVMAEHRFDVPA